MQVSDKTPKNIESTDNINTSHKVKRWLEIAGFLSVLFVMLKLMSYLMDPVRLGRPQCVGEKDTYFVSAMTEKDIPIDVAVFGDSESIVLLSPKILLDEGEISSYIVGATGERVSEAYYAIEDFFEVHNPKVILLEANMFFTTSGDARETLHSFNSIMFHTFPVFRYHNSWKALSGINHSEPLTHFRGFDERTEVNPYTGDEYMIPTDDKESIIHTNIYYMDKICELCKKHGTEIVLVSAPSPTNHNYRRHNALQALADSKGLNYLDLNLLKDEIGLDWATDSLDGGDHINLSGSEKVSRYMIQYLKDNFDF